MPKKSGKKSAQHSRLVERIGVEPTWMSPDELLELFKPGDVVERAQDHDDPLIPLHDEINSTKRKPSGWTDLRTRSTRGTLYGNWTEKEVPRRWLVLNVAWDPSYCHLWIELMSTHPDLPTLRGWLKDPQDRVQVVSLEEKS